MRARVALFCFGLLLAVLWVRGPIASAASLEAAVATSLQRRGLTLAPKQVAWLEHAGGPLSLRPLLFVARRQGELDDVYYAEARVSANGSDRNAVLDLFWLTNLTRSSSAAEGSLVQSGPHVAFSVQVAGTTEAVVVLDTRGEAVSITRGWPFYARAQNAITNLQETGRLRGFGRLRYQLSASGAALALDAQQGRFLVQGQAAEGDALRIAIDPQAELPTQGAEHVLVQPLEKGRPGTLTWAVDTVRNLSFVGPAPVEWLEHKVFGLTDRVQRAYHELAGEPSEQRAEMRAALAVPVVAPKEQQQVALLTVTDPELRWPPAKLAPVLQDPVAGEGEWLPVVDEAFVNAYPNAPPAFYQTFLRVDAERPYVSAYVTLWDPRQVQLHLAMGTKEPQSATGETGSGLIPRDPRILDRLVGAFNGGFQALHGEFGMMAEGRVYLPPKPWAGTVAVFDDGRVGLGSWPGPDRSGWDEERANAQIPSDMIAMRQNLTSVVEDGEYNPWKRWWWGAAPEFADEQTYIARSGLCLTEEGHMAFLWGESMGPEELGNVMLALRCVRGIHLDMNSKHTGFEFYRPLHPSQPAPALARPLSEQEYEGPMEQGLGYRLRARLAVKTMTPLRFPRYSGRDPRDFFFLTLKPVLPGPPLAIAGAEVTFSTVGLPHAGWPHAFARTHVPDAPTGAVADAAKEPRGRWLVRIDTHRARPGPLAAAADAAQPLARLTGVSADDEGALALYTARERGLWRYAIGKPPEGAVVLVRGDALSAESPASRALGLDRDGFLVYAEADGPRARLDSLADAGVEAAIALPDDARLSFAVEGHQVSVDGEQELDAEGGLVFLAETRPAAQVMFPDVKPMPYQRWGFLQGQRVRYFPSGPPRFRTPENVLEEAEQAPQDAGVVREPPGK